MKTPEELKAYRAEWNRKNAEEQKAKKAAYYQANKEKLKQAVRKRYAEKTDDCKATMKAWYEGNRDKVLAEKKEYWEQNKAHILERRSEHDRQNPQRVTADCAVQRARAKGMEADSTFLKAMPCPPHCPILGTPIAFSRKTGQRPADNTASFDRLDSTKGYIPGNVQVISRRANTMKSDATPEELLKFADWIYRTYGKQDLPTTSG